MNVRVDEARQQVQAGRVDEPAGGNRHAARNDGLDPAIRDPDIGLDLSVGPHERCVEYGQVHRGGSLSMLR
ncbi:MAG: hypothetical protein ACK5TE_17725 [Pseudomonadota bacterium]